MSSRVKIGDLVQAHDVEDMLSQLGLVIATGEEEKPCYGGGRQILQFFSVLWQDPSGDGPYIRRYDINSLTTGYIKIVGRTK